MPTRTFDRCLSVAFAPDGKSLAAGYDDKINRVCEIVSSGNASASGDTRGRPRDWPVHPMARSLYPAGADHSDGAVAFPRERIHPVAETRNKKIVGLIANLEVASILRALPRPLERVAIGIGGYGQIVVDKSRHF
jgi:hypothetical protein